MSGHDKRPRLLFVARRAPYPLDNGARIRSYRLLTGLAATFETTLLTLEHHPASADRESQHEDLGEVLPGIQVQTIAGAGPRKRAEQLLSLLRRRSWTIGRYDGPVLRDAVRRLAAECEAEIIHFDDPGVALVGPLAGRQNVYSSHNVESRLLRGQAGSGNPVRRVFSTIEAAKVAREEERIWRSMDVCLAVSESDRAAMLAGGARRVELCPNGVAEVAPLPLRALHDGEPMRLLFVGSGAYTPNERGLAWMVGEILPRIASRVPVQFDVVGAPPTNPISSPNVRYLGRVPEVDPYYDRAHAVVVPVLEGGGTRLKAIEAAAHCRPVVSTTMGADGLPLEPGVDFLRADDTEQFADAIVQLAGWCRHPSDGPLPRMVDRARERVWPLTWGRIVDSLTGLYLSLLGSAATAPPRMATGSEVAR